MYRLYITNKNYSSWSLRPWLLMKVLGIPFEEKLVPLSDNNQNFKVFSPTGKVPCLMDDRLTVWDSLSITEYLAESHAGIWPEDPKARAWARSACAEMHSGFTAMRTDYTMNIGLRIRPHPLNAALQSDIRRIDELWQQGMDLFGGPFLTGHNFTAVDAFFTPVAFRFQTYGTALSQISERYKSQLLSMPEVQEWQTAALSETSRKEEYEMDAKSRGEWIEDLRAR